MSLKDKLAGLMSMKSSSFAGLQSATTQNVDIYRKITAARPQAINLLHETLKYADVTLNEAAATAIEVSEPRVSAFTSDPRIRDNLDTIIEELKRGIKMLRKALDDPKRSEQFKSIGNALEHLKTVLNDLKRTRKFLVTTASSQGPPTDTLMTTYLGAMIGPIFGVTGAASGALVGAAVGMAATRAGILGNSVVKNQTETGSSDSDESI